MYNYKKNTKFVQHKHKNSMFMKRIVPLFLFLLCCISLSAQKYIVDPLFSDSIEVSSVSFQDSIWTVKDGFTRTMIPRGTEIDSCARSRSAKYYIIFEYEGKKYEINKKELLFSENNPEGVENPLSSEVQRRHSAIGHWFATMAPSYIVMALLLLSFIISFICSKWDVDALRPVALVIITASILIVSILELVGYRYLEGDVFWWCDYDRYGFFGALLRVIPFGLVVLGQIKSIYWFQGVLLTDEDDPEGISLKPAAIGLCACIPVLVVYALVVQVAIGWKGTLSDVIAVVLTLGTLFGGLIMSGYANIERMGVKRGIICTLFSIVYILGCIVAVLGLLVVLFRLIIQVLLVIGAIIMIMCMGGGRRYRDSWGNVYEEGAFGTLRKVN